MGWTATDIPDRRGRTAVLTGTNGGLGLETARELARHGAQIVLAVGNQAKAAAARDSHAEELHGATFEVIELDLGSLESVRAAAATILQTHPVNVGNAYGSRSMTLEALAALWSLSEAMTDMRFDVDARVQLARAADPVID